MRRESSLFKTNEITSFKFQPGGRTPWTTGSNSLSLSDAGRFWLTRDTRTVPRFKWFIGTSTVIPNLPVSSERLKALCRQWRVRELSLFGSVLRDDYGPGSDVDLLVSFEEDAPWSLWDLIALKDALSELFGRPVDLVEREALKNPFRRKRILETKQTIYVAGPE